MARRQTPAAKARKNPRKKPRCLPRHLTPGNPGNSGGKPGRSGRKALAWKALCTNLLRDPKAQDELRAAVQDRTTRGYAQLLKLLASYAVGLPVQTIRLGGLMSVAQRIEALSDDELEQFLRTGDEALLAALVTAADEDTEEAGE